MPYITKEQGKTKRDALKKALPQYKLSITTENYSGIKVVVQSGPVDFGIEYSQLNPYIDYREERWNRDTNKHESQPLIADLMDIIMPILNEGKGEGFQDSDYGHVPDYYTWVHIGKWDVPYKITTKSKVPVKRPLGKKVSAYARYPEGYLPKIQYWTQRMSEEAVKGNLSGVEFASKKLEYFMEQQKSLAVS